MEDAVGVSRSAVFMGSSPLTSQPGYPRTENHLDVRDGILVPFQVDHASTWAKDQTPLLKSAGRTLPQGNRSSLRIALIINRLR